METTIILYKPELYKIVSNRSTDTVHCILSFLTFFNVKKNWNLKNHWFEPTNQNIFACLLNIATIGVVCFYSLNTQNVAPFQHILLFVWKAFRSYGFSTVSLSEIFIFPKHSSFGHRNNFRLFPFTQKWFLEYIFFLNGNLLIFIVILFFVFSTFFKERIDSLWSKIIL